jgi:hypothetical protein
MARDVMERMAKAAHAADRCTHYVDEPVLRRALVARDPEARTACGIRIDGAPFLLLTIRRDEETCRACRALASQESAATTTREEKGHE